MALQVIMGSSGAGKSHLVYERVIRESQTYPERTYLVVVPEQFTMQTQQELVALHPGHAVMNIDILSFQRLAYRVFAEVGGDLRPLLDETGKALVLQKIALKNKKKLEYLGSNLKKPGYIEEMKSVISELAQYRIVAEDLDRLIALSDQKLLLKRKLHDVQIIYRQFTEYMQERYVTPEEVLDVLCRVMDQSRLLKNSTVVLDGFTGFTPVQNQVVSKLLKLCKDVLVTVTTDEPHAVYRKNQHQQLFYMSRTLIHTLRQMAKEQQTEILPDLFVEGGQNGRFADEPALAFLEGHLFRSRKEQYGKSQDAVAIRAAANQLEEMNQVVQTIRFLVRTKGYRYRDIAVVTGDLPGYESCVVQSFERENIPYFLDRKQAVLMNPFVEYLRAALDMVSSGFSYESVFRYLRTGMSEVTREEADLLENYVLACGIRGFARWQREFTGKPRFLQDGDLDKINRIREKFAAEIGDFVEAFRSSDRSVAARTKALYHFIVRSRIQEKLKLREQEFQEQGKASLVKEYAQIYGIVMELFDKLVAVLGEEKVSQSDYQQILEAGFSMVQVGIIPPTADQVLVGDVQRTRLPSIKALFFVGVNEGIIPKPSGNGGVLTEEEREYLKERDVELAPTEREDMGMQRFYLYLNLTKPARKLYLSYAHTRSDGSSAAPAYLIGVVQKLFADLAVEKSDGKSVYEKLETPVQGQDLLLAGLGRAALWEEDDSWRELFSWYQKDPDSRTWLDQMLEAAFYENPVDHIGAAAAKALYGKVLENSATRLEQFAACAFSHFLQYGLKLKERTYFEFNAMDTGNVLHQSLERFSKLLKGEGKSWRTLTDEEQEDLVKRSLADTLQKEGYEALEENARERYRKRRLLVLLNRSVWALRRQLACGDFEPGGFEVSFELESLEAMQFRLAGDGQLKLKGRIDRIDLCQDEERCYVRVIDYKSGTKALSLTELYHGLQLQLVIYLNAAMELTAKQHPEKELHPAGAFYYRISDPLVQESWNQQQDNVEKQILKELRMNGLASSDPKVLEKMDHTISPGTKAASHVFPLSYNKDGSCSKTSSVVSEERLRLMSQFVSRKVQEIGSRILQGETKIQPYLLGQKDGCQYCPYHGVCGFDERLPGYEHRRLKAFADEEIWNEMKRRCEDGSALDRGTETGD